MKRTQLILFGLLALIWTGQIHAAEDETEQFRALLKDASQLVNTLPVLNEGSSVEDAMQLNVEETFSSIRTLHAKLQGNPMAHAQGYDISVLSNAIYKLMNLRIMTRRFHDVRTEPLLKALEKEIVSLSTILEKEMIPDYVPAESGTISVADGGYEGVTDEEKAALAKWRADFKKRIEDNRRNNILNIRQRQLGNFHRIFIKSRLPLVPESEAKTSSGG
ncbi:MAG: hypothetical protein ABII82_11415 [Verrucomicrobiota bacterium]